MGHPRVGTLSTAASRTLRVAVVVVIAAAASVGCKSLTPPTSAAPIRAAFYYPWFPEAWNQQGQKPFTNYSPTRGLYGAGVATVRAQIADMQYGGITAGIASWFGRGTTTDTHWPTLISAAQGTGFGWIPYYEPEGVGDPTPTRIAADLHYLYAKHRGTNTDSGIAFLNGKGTPVFVYNADDLTKSKGCNTVTRWTKARQLLKSKYGETIYVDLKVFPGYASCPGTPGINGWHQYGPASANQDFTASPGDGSYSISPGYWKSGAPYGTAPFLARDRARWKSSIASMNASSAKWELITTYNEWGEGTAIEASSGCRNPAPTGTYCNWHSAAPSDFLADLHAAPPS